MQVIEGSYMPLPKPICDGPAAKLYSAQQMTAYARACYEKWTELAAPTPSTQAVGEPWQVGDDTSSVQISRDGSTHKWGCKCEGCAPTTGSAPEQRNLEGLREQILAPRGIARDAAGWPVHTGARDSSGWLYHPAIPVCDEGTRVDKLLEAFGIETSFVSMESDASDFYDRWGEEGLCDCSSWVPTPPIGDGWLLLEIYDTEDGPCALFGRDWYEAEKVRKQAERAERRAALLADRAVGMAMTNEQGEKYGALLDSSIPDRTPLYAAQLVNTVIDVHHDPSWQEGYKEGYDDAEIVYKAAGVETFENTQGADARPVASIVEWIEETCAAYCIPKPFAIIEALQGAASAPREKT